MPRVNISRSTNSWSVWANRKKEKRNYTHRQRENWIVSAQSVVIEIEPVNWSANQVVALSNRYKFFLTVSHELIVAWNDD